MIAKVSVTYSSRTSRARLLARAVQSLLQLGLGLLGERRLQDGAAELAQRLDGLVRRPRLDHEEQRRAAGLQLVANLLLELFPDRALGQLAGQRAEPGPHGHAEQRDGEEYAEQQAPEHSPRRA